MDAPVVITLALAFALLVTSHVAVCAGLVLAGPPRWQGALALLVLPLAPVWGWARRRPALRAFTVCWLVSAAVYIVALVLAAT